MFNREKNPLIVISGYYGYENIGDEAILKAILESLREEIPNLKFIILSNNPSITSQTFNVKAVHRYNFPQIIKAILKSSVFISGGGGLIQDVTSFRNLQYYLGLILLAKILRKPVIIYAQGIGPLLHIKSKIFTKFICNLVDLITVRDYASKEELKKIGIKKEILVTADPALILENKRKNKNSLLPPVLKIGISVRPWKTKVDYINILARAGDYLIKNWQAEIFLIPFQISQDLNICLKIKEIMQNKVQILDNLKRVEEYLEFIGELDYLVAMRLHALIFALINQIPIIGIAYDPKVKNFLNEINAPYLEIEELDLMRIINLLEDLKRNNKKFKEILNKKFFVLKEKAKNNAYLVKKLINF